MDEGVQVHGVDELVSGSRRLFDRIGKRAPREFVRVAEDRARLVSARVPRKTGRMAAAVRASQTDDGASVAISRAEVPYAGWIEFGGTRGRPYVASGRYLTPTALDAGSELKSAGEKAANDEIGRAHWPRPRT